MIMPPQAEEGSTRTENSNQNETSTIERRGSAVAADQVGELLSDCDDKDDLVYDPSSLKSKTEHVMSRHRFSKRRGSNHVQADYASEHQRSAASTNVLRRRLNPRERQQPSLGDTDKSSEIRASNKCLRHPPNSASSSTSSAEEEDDDDSSSEEDDDDSSVASFADEAIRSEEFSNRNLVQQTRPCLSRSQSADQAHSFRQSDTPNLSPTSIAGFGEDTPSEEGALTRNSIGRRRPRLSRAKSADHFFKQNNRSVPSPTNSDDECLRPDSSIAPSEEGALTRNSVHRTRPQLLRTKSADQARHSPTKSEDECSRPDSSIAPSEQGALTRTSVHRTRPRLSRTTSADRLRPKPPCRTKSDECLRPQGGEEGTPASEGGALNRNSVHRTRPRLSRTTSADRLRPKPPSRTKSDECLRPHGGEEVAPTEGGALNRNSVHRTRPRISRTTSADRLRPKPPSRTKSDECLRPHRGTEEDAALSEGALNRRSMHRTRSPLSRMKSAERLLKQNEDRPTPPCRTTSDVCLRRPSGGAEDAPPSEQGALIRSSIHRSRPRLSRMKSADRLFKQNEDRPTPPSRTKSDVCVRGPSAEGAENAPPSEQGALNQSSGHRSRPRLSRMKSADRLFFKENEDRPTPPCRTKSDECLRRPSGGAEDAPSEGALNRNSARQLCQRPRLSRTPSAERYFNKQNDRPKPLARTNSDEFLNRPNAGGLEAHMARQTLRVNIKEHYRVDDLASASRSVASHASTIMSRRSQNSIGLDGVPPNVDDIFPKHVDEQFRKCRAVTIDRILNEAKDVQDGSSLQVNPGTSAAAEYSMPKYGEDNDDDDDDQPHVKGSGNSVTTSFRHLVRQVMIVKKTAKTINSTAKGISANGDVVRDPKRGDLVTKTSVNGPVKMDANATTTVAKGSLGTTGLDKKKRDHQDKDRRHDHEKEFQSNYNPEDLECRKTKSTSLLERVSGGHLAAKQQAAPSCLYDSSPGTNLAMHSLVIRPGAMIPQLGWDLR